MPFAVDLTVFSAFLAVVLIVFFPCRLVFISGFSAVWGASGFMAEKVSEADMTIMARDIAKRVEDEMDYPGQIKVNVIRESRAIEYAK